MQTSIMRATGVFFTGFAILSLNACTLFNTLGFTESQDELDMRLLTNLVVANAQNSQSSANTPILFHNKTSDFTTYTLEWIEAGPVGTSGVPPMFLYEDQISLTSGGIKSAQMYQGRLVFIDSSGSGAGALRVYDYDSRTQVTSLTLGTFPQEMIISGSTAYVPVQNTFGTGGGSDGQLLVLDLSDIDAPSISQTITTNISRDPGNSVLKNDVLYIQREGFGTGANIQTGVDIYDINNGFAQTHMATGDNPLQVADSDNKLFLVATGDSGTNGNLTTFTGASDPTSITAFPDTDGNATNEIPASCSSIAFPDTGNGYITLTDDSGTTCELFAINGFTGEIGSTAINAGTDYDFVGVGYRKNYLHRVSNGNGSASELTIEVQDLSGTTLNTFTVTRLGGFNHNFNAY